MKKYRVIDVFCGAGGFSEGFRQQGFDIVRGVDFWQPAIDTHNLNHNLNDKVQNVLDFRGKNSSDVSEIEKLEDVEIIIGSPSCVSFSNSNKSGKAEKSLGIKLIEAYLRLVVVKKHKKESKLIAWYMENVPNSKNYIKEYYTFNDLNLSGWAKYIGKNPYSIAVKVKENSAILNAKNYGAPQNRERYVAGERVKTGEFLNPQSYISNIKKLGDIQKNLPPVHSIITSIKHKILTDVNYKGLQINAMELTDHFYDTGIYKIERETAKYLKTSHPYMGKMSFPEDSNKPSRTITATRGLTARESIIYKSEYNRVGNGEYRMPTIREIATLMGFPYVYQFCGSEGVKWRQIGNAVSPHMANALAAEIRKKIGLGLISNTKINFAGLKLNYKKVNNLNTFKEKEFLLIKKRKNSSRFRRHPFKKGNMTVELMNYINNDKPINRNVSVFLGTGQNHKSINITKIEHNKIKKILKDKYKKYNNFEKLLESYFDSIGVLSGKELQNIFETDFQLTRKSNPLNIVDYIGKLVHNNLKNDVLIDRIDFISKDHIYLSQALSIYAMSKYVFYYIKNK